MWNFRQDRDLDLDRENRQQQCEPQGADAMDRSSMATSLSVLQKQVSRCAIRFFTSIKRR
jgi:hypothetical protein